MGPFSKVLLAIDKEHNTIESLGLWTRLRWVKPDLWAQLSHYICVKYIW